MAHTTNLRSMRNRDTWILGLHDQPAWSAWQVLSQWERFCLKKEDRKQLRNGTQGWIWLLCTCTHTYIHATSQTYIHVHSGTFAHSYKQDNLFHNYAIGWVANICNSKCLIFHASIISFHNINYNYEEKHKKFQEINTQETVSSNWFRLLVLNVNLWFNYSIGYFYKKMVLWGKVFKNYYPKTFTHWFSPPSSSSQWANKSGRCEDWVSEVKTQIRARTFNTVPQRLGKMISKETHYLSKIVSSKGSHQRLAFSPTPNQREGHVWIIYWSTRSGSSLFPLLKKTT